MKGASGTKKRRFRPQSASNPAETPPSAGASPSSAIQGVQHKTQHKNHHHHHHRPKLRHHTTNHNHNHSNHHHVKNHVKSKFSVNHSKSHHSNHHHNHHHHNHALQLNRPTIDQRIASTRPKRARTGKSARTGLGQQAQLDELRAGKVDLEGTDSIIGRINLKSLVNYENFNRLPTSCRAHLVKLLPQIDQVIENSSSSTTSSTTTASRKKPSDSALTNEFFSRACADYQERLKAGKLLPDFLSKKRAEEEKDRAKLDPWKLKHFEPVWGIRAAEAELNSAAAAKDQDRTSQQQQVSTSVTNQNHATTSPSPSSSSPVNNGSFTTTGTPGLRKSARITGNQSNSATTQQNQNQQQYNSGNSSNRLGYNSFLTLNSYYQSRPDDPIDKLAKAVLASRLPKPTADWLKTMLDLDRSQASPCVTPSHHLQRHSSLDSNNDKSVSPDDAEPHIVNYHIDHTVSPVREEDEDDEDYEDGHDDDDTLDSSEEDGKGRSYQSRTNRARCRRHRHRRYRMRSPSPIIMVLSDDELDPTKDTSSSANKKMRRGAPQHHNDNLVQYVRGDRVTALTGGNNSSERSSSKPGSAEKHRTDRQRTPSNDLASQANEHYYGIKLENCSDGLDGSMSHAETGHSAGHSGQTGNARVSPVKSSETSDNIVCEPVLDDHHDLYDMIPMISEQNPPLREADEATPQASENANSEQPTTTTKSKVKPKKRPPRPPSQSPTSATASRRATTSRKRKPAAKKTKTEPPPLSQPADGLVNTESSSISLSNDLVVNRPPHQQSAASSAQKSSSTLNDTIESVVQSSGQASSTQDDGPTSRISPEKIKPHTSTNPSLVSPSPARSSSACSDIPLGGAATPCSTSSSSSAASAASSQTHQLFTLPPPAKFTSTPAALISSTCVTPIFTSSASVVSATNDGPANLPRVSMLQFVPSTSSTGVITSTIKWIGPSSLTTVASSSSCATGESNKSSTPNLNIVNLPFKLPPGTELKLIPIEATTTTTDAVDSAGPTADRVVQNGLGLGQDLDDKELSPASVSVTITKVPLTPSRQVGPSSSITQVDTTQVKTASNGPLLSPTSAMLTSPNPPQPPPSISSPSTSSIITQNGHVVFNSISNPMNNNNNLTNTQQVQPAKRNVRFPSGLTVLPVLNACPKDAILVNGHVQHQDSKCTSPLKNGQTPDGNTLPSNCFCNHSAMRPCRLCNAFCHVECMSMATILTTTTPVNIPNAEPTRTVNEGLICSKCFAACQKNNNTTTTTTTISGPLSPQMNPSPRPDPGPMKMNPSLVLPANNQLRMPPTIIQQQQQPPPQAHLTQIHSGGGPMKGPILLSTANNIQGGVGVPTSIIPTSVMYRMQNGTALPPISQIRPVMSSNQNLHPQQFIIHHQQPPASVAQQQHLQHQQQHPPSPHQLQLQQQHPQHPQQINLTGPRPLPQFIRTTGPHQIIHQQHPQQQMHMRPIGPRPIPQFIRTTGPINNMTAHNSTIPPFATIHPGARMASVNTLGGGGPPQGHTIYMTHGPPQPPPAPPPGPQHQQLLPAHLTYQQHQQLQHQQQQQMLPMQSMQAMQMQQQQASPHPPPPIQSPNQYQQYHLQQQQQQQH